MELKGFYNIDCMEGMKNIPDKYFDLAIVDPPYFEGPNKRGFYGRRVNKLNIKRHEYKNIYSWSIPDQHYFKELLRVSKNQIICGGNYFNLPPCRCFVVWDKRQPWKNFSACEYLWTSFNAPAKLFSHLFRQKRIHPTQKPVALYEYLIKTFAKQGDKILDTHLGSGSSRIAAYNLGFDFVGCEINKSFFDKQQERFINECQ